MFPKAIEHLEQNIRKQIDCKRPLTTKQMSKVQNIRIEIWKYKAVECFEIYLGKVTVLCLHFQRNS